MTHGANETQVNTTSHCRRCGRSLRSAKSVATGYGPTCARKIAAAAAASTDQPAQVAKATQLIEDGGLERTSPTTWLAVSSDGSTRYEINTVTASCSCPAAQHGRRCYHAVAVELVSGAPVAAPTPLPARDPFAGLPRDTADPFADNFAA